MENMKLVGRCGLYCGACGIYRAYKDKGEYLQKLANFFKCPPEKVKCEGCHDLKSDSWGMDCKLIKCLDVKGLEFCYQCSEYEEISCEKFNSLAKGYLEEHNVDLRANLQRIKAGETKEWVKESKEKFKCPYCRKALSVSSRFKECYHCGAQLSK